MDKVVELVTIAENRIAEINDELKTLESKLQALKDEKHVILAALEAVKKAEREVCRYPMTK